MVTSDVKVAVPTGLPIQLEVGTLPMEMGPCASLQEMKRKGRAKAALLKNFFMLRRLQAQVGVMSLDFYRSSHGHLYNNCCSSNMTAVLMLDSNLTINGAKQTSFDCRPAEIVRCRKAYCS